MQMPEYIGETKRQLNERFGEHRRSDPSSPALLAGFLCRQVREASGEAARDFCKLQARRTRHFEGSGRRGERKIKLLPSSRLATSHPLGEGRKPF